MDARKAQLKLPLNLNIGQLAAYFPEFRYQPPRKSTSSNTKERKDAYFFDDLNIEKFLVLHFDDKTDQGFNSIESEYSPKELAFLFTRLPEDIFSLLNQALEGTPLELPILTEAEKNTFVAAYEKQKQRELKLQTLKHPLKNLQEINFSSQEGLNVLQHEYAIVDAESAQPVVGTFGAGPCVILGLYDKKNKKAIIAHIDALTKIKSLASMFDTISKENTVAHLAGGDDSSQAMCIKIVELLQACNIPIENADLMNNNAKRASLAIDSRTGAIFSPVNSSHFQPREPNSREKIELVCIKSAIRQYNPINNADLKNELPIVKEVPFSFANQSFSFLAEPYFSMEKDNKTSSNTANVLKNSS